MYCLLKLTRFPLTRGPRYPFTIALADPELTRPGIVAISGSPKSTLLSWPLQLMRNPNRVVYPRRNDSH